jgi:hypothetical protein
MENGARCCLAFWRQCRDCTGVFGVPASNFFPGAGLPYTAGRRKFPVVKEGWQRHRTIQNFKRPSKVHQEKSAENT